MTHEYAVYFKLLLLCGYKDDMEQFLDAALAEQDAVSDIVLELSLAGSDDRKRLAILNEYIRQVQDSDIDYDAVFKLVMAFLKKRYVENAMYAKDIAGLMERIPLYTERDLDGSWYAMRLWGRFFYDAEKGYIDKADYQRKFDAFINGYICDAIINDDIFLCDHPPLPKESFFKRLIKKCCKGGNRYK